MVGRHNDFLGCLFLTTTAKFPEHPPKKKPLQGFVKRSKVKANERTIIMVEVSLNDGK
jgi:hypothetical protein